MTFDYTDCEKLTPSTANGSLNFVDLPSNKYLYRLSAKDQKNANPRTPRYAFLDNTNNASVTDVSDKKQCVIEFDVPADLRPTVLLYYKLSNFYQNHRRYVKSLDSNQLKGKGVSPKTLENGDCKPLASVNNTAIYPCGLIANSLFNGQSEQIMFFYVTDHPSRYLFNPHSREPFRFIRIITTLPTLVERHRMARRIQEIRHHTNRLRRLRKPVRDCATAQLGVAIPQWLYRGQPSTRSQNRRTLPELDAHSRSADLYEALWEE